MIEMRYRTLVPGQRHFDCEALRCTLSSTACGQRFQAAQPGAACSGCVIGRMHAAETNAAPPPAPQRNEPSAAFKSCARCGRRDLRIIRVSQICVSCQNREYEWFKGRDAKGKPPLNFEPLHWRVVAIKTTDGALRWNAGQHRHQVEALTFTVRKRLPPGAKFSPETPGAPVWSGIDGRFVMRCPACNAPGLLERLHERTAIMKHHCPACGGPAPGIGWSLATPREPVLMLAATSAAFWLAQTGEAPIGTAWQATEFVCGACLAGQIEARVQSGRVECRCLACGAAGSASDHAAGSHCGSA